MSKEDINLPKTSFSMKANLPIKEPEILKIWEKLDLYKKLRELRKGKEKFVLHDGPPYANGHIHMGTALNKILKDIIIRFESMKSSSKANPKSPCSMWQRLTSELKSTTSLSEVPSHDFMNPLR